MYTAITKGFASSFKESELGELLDGLIEAKDLFNPMFIITDDNLILKILGERTDEIHS